MGKERTEGDVRPCNAGDEIIIQHCCVDGLPEAAPVEEGTEAAPNIDREVDLVQQLLQWVRHCLKKNMGTSRLLKQNLPGQLLEPKWRLAILTQGGPTLQKVRGPPY